MKNRLPLLVFFTASLLLGCFGRPHIPEDGGLYLEDGGYFIDDGGYQFPDGGPIHDGGVLHDGGALPDGGPDPDGGPVEDGGPFPDGGPAPDGGPIPDGGETDSFRAYVTSTNGYDLENATVVVNGQEAVYEYGRHYLDQIYLPFNATVIAREGVVTDGGVPTALKIATYHGVQYSWYITLWVEVSESEEPARRATLSGSVSAGESDGGVELFLGLPSGKTELISNVSGPFSGEINWRGASYFKPPIVALQYRGSGIDGRQYDGYWLNVSKYVYTGSNSLGILELYNTGLTSSSCVAAVQLPQGGYALEEATVSLRVGEERLALVKAAAPASQFSMTYPSFSGAQTFVTIRARDPQGRPVWASKLLVPQSPLVFPSIYAATSLQSPADGAQNIDLKPGFSFTPMYGANLNVLTIRNGDNSFVHTIYSPYNYIVLPDLGAFGAGLKPSTTYYWQVESRFGTGTPNRVVQAEQYPLRDPIAKPENWTSRSRERSFTTAP